MKKELLRFSAAAAMGVAAFGAAHAGQTPETPAGTEMAPKPTVEEDLVYLKDIVALQTMRLDEAEQLIARQTALIEAQAAQIATLQQQMAGIADSGAIYASAGGTYRVASGDTLGGIASRNNTSVAALAQINDLKAPYPIRVGQTLKLPGAAPQAVPAAAPQPAPARQPAPKPQMVADAGAAQKQETPAPAKTDNTASAADAPQGSQPPAPQRVAANAASGNDQPRDNRSDTPEEVGVRPDEENERPYLAIFSDAGGILTPRGSMYLEPSFDYTVTSDNRFFFQGIEIIDAVLIGAIEATDTDRRALTETVGLRYGLTSRLEIEARAAYINRNDRISGVAIDDQTTSVRELDGSGFGDVEAGIHYQLNNGRKFPYTVANLRVKAPTGNGPFEVARDPDNGVETELATGSGFWTIEPSLTFILSSDPASLFANIGYQYNMPTSPNSVLVDTTPFRSTLTEFDPGDAIRTSIGVGLSLNERLSMNFGYDQSYFFKTENAFEIVTRTPITVPDGPDADDDPDIVGYENPITATSITRTPATTVGSFLFGGSYAINDQLRINLNGAIGATDEAPDARISIRAQYKLFD